MFTEHFLLKQKASFTGIVDSRSTLLYSNWAEARSVSKICWIFCSSVEKYLAKYSMESLASAIESSTGYLLRRDLRKVSEMRE